MFKQLDVAPPDAILGLTEAFNQDPNPKKVNLSVGVYKDAEGKTPTLLTVKEAEKRLLEEEASKSYLPIQGGPDYAQCVQELMFGKDHEVMQNERAATAQTPGGTAALRVAADFLHQKFADASVWLPAPTWPNHPGIFTAAGVPVREYPYYDKDAQAIDESALMDALEVVPPGDVVLFHGCCHNPSGMDPNEAQWKTISEVSRERGWIPLLDFAYQGFGDGLEEDAAGLRALLDAGGEMLVCSSFSKNFGLYRERVGALTIVGAASEDAQKALGHMKRAIRTNYSNPPSHGASVVTTILSDAHLRARWVDEVGEMRDRINGMRRLFVDALAKKGVEKDFSFLIHQRGMFSFSGLTASQVQRLREEYSIYVVGSGRINVAGMTEANMDYLCSAMADVLKG